MSEEAVVFGGGVLGRRIPLCVRSSRSARARADLDEDSAIYEKGRSGVVLGRGDRLGWQR